MTRLNSAFVLRRASERLSAGAAASLSPARAAHRRVAPQNSKPTDGIVGALFAARRSRHSPKMPPGCIASSSAPSRKVCGLSRRLPEHVRERTRANRCYEQTLADVVRKIDRPMLTSVHDSKLNKVG